MYEFVLSGRFVFFSRLVANDDEALNVEAGRGVGFKYYFAAGAMCEGVG